MADSDFALAAILEYKRFFFLLIESDEDCGAAAYVPSAAVGKAWQRHMLDTEQYFFDCEELESPLPTYIGTSCGAPPPGRSIASTQDNVPMLMLMLYLLMHNYPEAL